MSELIYRSKSPEGQLFEFPKHGDSGWKISGDKFEQMLFWSRDGNPRWVTDLEFRRLKEVRHVSTDAIRRVSAGGYRLLRSAVPARRTWLPS